MVLCVLFHDGFPRHGESIAGHGCFFAPTINGGAYRGAYALFGRLQGEPNTFDGGFRKGVTRLGIGFSGGSFFLGRRFQ